MSAMKIKKGDTVKVITGKDKGKDGKVLAVNVKDNTVVVENVNMVTKHAKPSAANQNGGIDKRSSASYLQRNARCRRKSYKSWIQDGWRQKVRVAKSNRKDNRLIKRGGI